MTVARVYAWLLRAYPRRFRERHAAGMQAAFAAGYARARASGTAGRYLARALLDIALNATLERRDAARHWRLEPPKERPMPWHSTWMDVRYACRLFARAPGFTALVALTLALGIGANSAVFTLVSGILLTPLPYAEPDRLVTVWGVNQSQGGQPSALLEGDVIDIRRAVTTLAAVEAFQANLVPVQLTLESSTLSARAVAMTPGTFALLGREALVGRTLRDGDRFAILLSHGYWQRQFGGDPGIVGRQVTVGRNPATVVGVMPPEFAFPAPSMLLAAISFTRGAGVDLWVPMTLAASRDPKDTLRIVGAVGRMAPGVTIDQVRADTASVAAALARAHPRTNAGWSTAVTAVHDQTVAPARPALLLLSAAVALVLLMACANVANLILARSTRRQREMAVRAALGANRARLLRQAVTEGLLLSLLGGGLAWLVVRWGMPLFVRLAPADVPRLAEVTPDWRVFAYTALVALAAGVLTAVLPALAASRPAPRDVLADGTRSTSGRSGVRLRSTLVAVEVALAVLVTVGAGLLVRSFTAVLRVDPGFRSENLLTFQVNVPDAYDSAEKRRAFYGRLFGRLQEIPGVTAVGGTTRLPLGGANSSTQVTIDGRDPARGGLVEADLRRAMHDYFAVMGIPVVRGRAFDRRDGPEAPAVVIVNQTMARRVFPGEDPIGKRVTLAPNAGIKPATIVGIVGDVRHESLEAAPRPEIYIHYLQNPPSAPLVVLRTMGDPSAAAADVRIAALEIDPALRLFDLRTMADLRGQAIAERRFLTVLGGVFGAVALLLAALGVFGVMAVTVAERTAEMGIRLALGAEPRQVLSLVVRQGLHVAGAGVAVGLAAALALAPLMAGQLFGIAPTDALTLAGVPTLLLAVALVACAIPARRAMRVDPVTALRDRT